MRFLRYSVNTFCVVLTECGVLNVSKGSSPFYTTVLLHPSIVKVPEQGLFPSVRLQGVAGA
jgi:hypothetical protein